MALRSTSWLAMVILVRTTLASPIAPFPTIKSYHADFESIETFPYTGAPELGYYGGGPGYMVGPYEAPPTPYKGLAWENGHVINGFRGYHQEYPVVYACSGNKSLIAEARGTGVQKRAVTGLTLNYTGNTATSFSLASCCVACFVDYDGTYKGSNSEGYPYYYDDLKRAVNCTISFTGKTATGQIKQAVAQYDLGCVKNGINCHKNSRPMATVTFGGLLDDVFEVQIKVESFDSGNNGGFCSHPDGCGPHVDSLHVLSMMLDSFRYHIKS